MNSRICSRRHALLALLGPAASGLLAAPDAPTAVRLAISESVVGNVNLNDARAAMQIWVKRLTANLNVILDPKLFSTTEEIVDRAHKGLLDAVALNVLEYRQIASLFDASQIVSSAGDGGFEQYQLLVKRSSGMRRLADLKSRRLYQLQNSKMCLASLWLSVLLEQAGFGLADQFFSSTTAGEKFSRVILPVFFGQADCCLTSKRGFDTMCELNPQVGRELIALASSDRMMVSFYVFRKNYRNTEREKLIRAISGLRKSPAGQELATLFQFDELCVRDASCLTTALDLLERGDHLRLRTASGGRLP